MFINHNAKAKVLLAGAVVMLASLACPGASGGEWNGAGGKYARYGENEAMAMLDAINRDYPPEYSGLDRTNRYMRYGENEAGAMLEAIDRDHPVSAGVPSSEKYLAYGENETIDMLDAINHDAALANRAPAYAPAPNAWPESNPAPARSDISSRNGVQAPQG